MNTGDEYFDTVKELLLQYRFNVEQSADDPIDLLDGFYVMDEDVETTAEDSLEDIFTRNIIQQIRQLDEDNQ